ncbi:MAG: FAD-dependent monooxygenase [Myxococcota bacterium]|nr:FAD-dependent monooxygenase [Myxococcota bacterium]
MARVAIAGAGPGGAALAHVLARTGNQVTLIERQRDFAREFRGEVLMPSGVDVLHQLGLGEAFARVPQRIPQGVELYRDRKCVASAPFDLDDEAAPRITAQPPLLEMLVAECERFESFRFVRGQAVRDLVRRESDDRIAGLILADGERIEADLVVGADGRGSIVRRRAGLQAERNPESFDVVWFKVPLPESMAERGSPVSAYIGRGHFAIAFPTPDDCLQVAWIIDKGTFSHLRQGGIETWVDEMANHVSDELGVHIRKNRDRLERPFVLDVLCDCMPSWWAPGALLIGDAVHPMSPVAGQGLNIALRDSIVAANHLVPVLAAGAEDSAVDAACASIQEERMPEVSVIQTIQRSGPNIMLRRKWWSGIALRLMPFVVQSQVANSRGSALFSRVAFGVTDVKLQL